jgi:NADH-quinone oxidoreductase subunit J
VSSVVFYPLAVLTVVGAAGVILSRNPVRSAMWLVATLALLAVFFVALHAHLVAALQIIVYAGAVMVLFLFVIMLLNLQQDPGEGGRLGLKTLALGGSAAASALFARVLWVSSSQQPVASLPEGFGTTKVLARVLFGEYLVAFELTSVLLLVAIVGAIVLARREPAASREVGRP